MGVSVDGLGRAGRGRPSTCSVGPLPFVPITLGFSAANPPMQRLDGSGLGIWMDLGGEMIPPRSARGDRTLSPALCLNADAALSRPDGNKVPTDAPVLFWLFVSAVMLVLGGIGRSCSLRQSGGHGGFRGRRGDSCSHVLPVSVKSLGQLALSARAGVEQRQTRTRQREAPATAATKQLPRHALWRAAPQSHNKNHLKPLPTTANHHQPPPNTGLPLQPSFSQALVNLATPDDPSRSIATVTAALATLSDSGTWAIYPASHSIISFLFRREAALSTHRAPAQPCDAKTTCGIRWL